MSAPFTARWAVALRLGRRDAAAHRLRSALVVVLVAVATGVVALPAVALARAMTPESLLGISGTRYDGLEDRFVRIDPATFTTLGIVGAVAALQAVVLIAPAFLLGVRRRVRELGVISAAGASPSDLRRAILAPALICGAVGAAVGASVALVLVLLAVPVGNPDEILTGTLAAMAAALFGVTISVAAAWYPAVVAMRDSAPGAMPGVSSHRGAPWLLPVALAAVAGGTVLAVHGAASRPVQVIAGVGVAEAGLVGVVAVLLGALERVPGRGAVTAYVLRDAARHRVRVLPAVAAGLAMVALASAGMVYQQTQHAAETSGHLASAPVGSALVLSDDDDLTELTDRADRAGIRILSPDAADELGLTVRGIGALYSDDGPLDPWQVALLGQDGADVVQVEEGAPDLSDPWTQYGLVAAGILAVLLVTWVTTALAAQEARADLETLEAVGAPPGTRRRMAAGQAGLVATLGAWCGVPAGIALGALLVDVQASQAIMGGRPGPDLSVPWWPLATLLVVLPIAVALLSALTAPTGIRLTRHVDR